MTESPAPAPPGVIPYVDHHTGPKRLVILSLDGGAGSPLKGYSQAMVKPNVFVDGRQYIVYWGRVTFEVPADRAVHIGVGMQDGLRGASMLLPPGPEHVELAYVAPAMGEVSFGLASPPSAPRG